MRDDVVAFTGNKQLPKADQMIDSVRRILEDTVVFIHQRLRRLSPYRADRLESRTRDDRKSVGEPR